MLSAIKKLRRSILGRYRFFFLKLSNWGISVGRGFFCAGGCRASRGRSIRIGKNFYMGFGCHLGANMIVGDNVMFASEVAVVGGDHKIDYVIGPIRDSGRDVFKTAIFGDGCWVGHRAIVMHGVTVGPGAVVAAGSIVTKDVEANAIVAGNPARFIRYRKS